MKQRNGPEVEQTKGTSSLTGDEEGDKITLLPSASLKGGGGVAEVKRNRTGRDLTSGTSGDKVFTCALRAATGTLTTEEW
jgi:hypothetical protein